MLNIEITRALFNDIYIPYLFDYSRRFEVYYGGAGSGKSIFVSQKLFIKALNDKRKVLVIRKVGRTLKDSVFQLFLDLLDKFQIREQCKINLTTFTIELPNGSILLFKGLDDSEKIKSITNITDIWIEEATELNEEEYLQLDLRLRASVPNLQLIVSFNPVSKVNFCYKRWFAPEAVVGADTFILQTTYKDNRFLPAEYIASLESLIQSNPTYYKIYVLGEFCSLDKLVFNDWQVGEFNHADINGKLLVGLDFGFVNDTSALVGALLCEDEKTIYIFKEWGETNRTNEELANVIKALGFSKSLIIADAAEPKSIEEIRRFGIQKIKACAKGADSVVHGIQRLQQYHIVIHPSCAQTITEFQNYSWQKDKKTGEYINKPIDDFNHFIDALRYSLQCVFDNKLKTMPKAALGL